MTAKMKQHRDRADVDEHLGDGDEVRGEHRCRARRRRRTSARGTARRGSVAHERRPARREPTVSDRQHPEGDVDAGVVHHGADSACRQASIAGRTMAARQACAARRCRVVAAGGREARTQSDDQHKARRRRLTQADETNNGITLPGCRSRPRPAPRRRRRSMLMIAIGVIHFHAKASSWSMRKRGSVPRVQTKMKYTA